MANRSTDGRTDAGAMGDVEAVSEPVSIVAHSSHPRRRPHTNVLVLSFDTRSGRFGTGYIDMT